MLRSLQGYLRDTFGSGFWATIVREADLPTSQFEPMLRYDPAIATVVADAAARILGRPASALWEDMGTYIVTNPAYEGVRRLLRFGGVGFNDFLHSLEELPGRARLALPDLRVPDISVDELAPDRFRLTCRFDIEGMALVLLGILRAMADDYGALALIDRAEREDGAEVLLVTIHQATHAEAKPFDLALPAAP
jgi:hypothetical protein